MLVAGSRARLSLLMVDILQDKSIYMNKHANIIAAEIKGVVTCLPKNKITNSFFENFLTKDEINGIEKVSGVKTRYWVEGESGVDLCVEAGKNLMFNLGWSASDIDAVIYVTQSPDYVLPASAIKIAGKLNLEPGYIAYDVNLGCSGYPYGLFLAETMIASGIATKVLLFAGETTSKIIDKKEKSTALIFGDAGSATALELSTESPSLYLLGSDSSGEKNLIVPASRFCQNVMEFDSRISGRNPSYIYMDGAEVFNFTLKTVPHLVSDAKKLSNEGIDYYLFHQANKFMLDYLIKKMKIDPLFAPINIESYGNTSSVSIPLLLTTSLNKIVKKNNLTKLGLFGFGVGYSWSACVKAIKKDVVLNNIYLS